MSKKAKNPNCVTRSECHEISGSIKNELVTIKMALVGDDMRGGMVRELAEIKTNLNNKHNGLGKKERVLIYTSALTTTGIIISEVIKCLA